jgi:1-deoxy-D-xylulose-5-phosphate reductoisomerase
MSAVRVAIAGSSGSIGTQTLDVVRAEAGRYEVVALGVGSSVDVLVQQALEFRPKVVAVADASKRAEVAAALPFAHVVADFADLVDVADVVVNAVVGFAGLPVTVRTLQHGKRLALANKESLIAAGPVVQPLRHRQRALCGASVLALVGVRRPRGVAHRPHGQRRTVQRPHGR